MENFLFFLQMSLIPYKTNLVFLAVLCIVLLSCNFEFWKDSSPIIAEVENTRLHINELREAGSKDDSNSREDWVHRIDAWINFEVMYREALKRGLQNDPATQKLIKNAEKKILVDKLRMAIDSTVYIESEKELRDFYEKNIEVFCKESDLDLDSDSDSDSDSISVSVSYIPFSEVIPQIQSMVLSEKRNLREKKWLTEIKNSYSIDVYPQYLDSL
jgi:hypothetical protein